MAVDGRPDFADKSFGVTAAKSWPPYVFSRRGGALVHCVREVRLRWYRPDYGRLVRLKRPIAVADTECGQFFVLRAGRGETCRVPALDAVLCDRCNGEPATFGKRGRALREGFTRRDAKLRIGCVSEAE